MYIAQVYRDAWTKEAHETKGQYRRDVFVSLAAPMLVCWAVWSACCAYQNDAYYGTAVVVSVLVLLVSVAVLEMACCALTRRQSSGRDTAARSEEDAEQEPPRGSPMLAFAALLFTTGAAFTVVEIFDYLADETIGPGGGEFRSPWGDPLLGFSALCMLAEEFSLFNTYNAVKREVSATRQEVEQVKAVRREISDLGHLAQGKYKQVEESCESAKKKHQQTEECLKSTRRIQKEVGQHLNGLKKLHDAALEKHRSMRSSERRLARRIAIRAAFYVVVLQTILIALLVYAAGS